MAIKITYSKLSRLAPALVKLRAVDEKASIIERARLARFVRPLWGELGEYEKLRNELLAKYGKAVEGGQPGAIRIEPDNVKIYTAEMIKLTDIEAELPISPLPVALYSLANLTVEDMDNLGDLIVWPADDEAEAPATPVAK